MSVGVLHSYRTAALAIIIMKRWWPRRRDCSLGRPKKSSRTHEIWEIDEAGEWKCVLFFGRNCCGWHQLLRSGWPPCDDGQSISMWAGRHHSVVVIRRRRRAGPFSYFSLACPFSTLQNNGSEGDTHGYLLRGMENNWYLMMASRQWRPTLVCRENSLTPSEHWARTSHQLLLQSPARL